MNCLNILNIIRSLKGYVIFEAEGEEVYRLLNQAYVSNILLWSVKEHQDKITATVSYKDFKELTKMSKSFGIKITPLKYSGIIRYFNQYKNRIGLAVGIALFMLFLFVSSSVIWEIEVEGNEKVSDETIISLMNDGGIKLWRNCDNIDAKKLADNIASKVNEIDWLGINIIGSKVIVKVKEVDEPPEVYSKDPCNIVASKDGVIVSVETYDGRSTVQKGDVVKKGDLLISGIISDDRSHTYLRSAKSKVIAKTYETKQFEKELESVAYVPTNDFIINKYLIFFGKDIPFITNHKFQGKGFCSETTEDVRLGKVHLPFLMKVKKFTPFKKETIKLSPEKAKYLAEQDMAKFEYEKQKSSKIIKKEAKAEIIGNKFVCTVNYVFEENIAKIQKILQNSSTT